MANAISTRNMVLMERDASYEAVGSDARYIADALGLNITNRGGQPLVQIPASDLLASLVTLWLAGWNIALD